MSTRTIVPETSPLVNPRYAAVPPVVAVERMLPCPGKDENAAARFCRLYLYGRDLRVEADPAEGLVYWVESGSRPDLAHRVEWHNVYPCGYACGCEFGRGNAAYLCKHVARLTGPDYVGCICPCCGSPDAVLHTVLSTGAALCLVCLFRADLTADEAEVLVDMRGGWGDPVSCDALLLGVYARVTSPATMGERRDLAFAGLAELEGSAA